MSKQRTKRPTVGRKILADFKREYDSMKPGQVINGYWWTRRIDRALASAVRKERERCAKIALELHGKHSVCAEHIRRTPRRSTPTP